MGKKADLPKCANYPVQRAALSVMARAIVRHKASLDSERHMDAHILATIHDALIDEASIVDAEKCLSIMREDMMQGYLDVFPNASVDRLVEGGIGPDWGHLN
jgi:DNA polymerase I-like protein with 3'-5' exonuclease and polymerase domains